MHNMYTLNNRHINRAVKPSKILLPDFTQEADCFGGQRYSQKNYGGKREGVAIASAAKNRILFQNSLIEQILEVSKIGFIYQKNLLCVCITIINPITHIIYVYV